LAGFTFVGREAQVAAFRQMLERPEGEALLVAGAEGCGKSHLLRQLRHEAERVGRHVVLHCCLGHLLDADLRQYAILSSVAAAHEPAALHAGGMPSERGPAGRLVPNPREFFGHLLGEDHRPVSEKLLGLLSVASGHLAPESRLVLLLDLGRAQSGNAFPVEYLTRRLPENVKLVIAAGVVPEGLADLRNAAIVPELPPFGEAEVARLLDFHLPRGTAVQPLAAVALEVFQGSPLLTDLAAKLVADSASPAAALGTLPASAPDLCQQLLAHLSEEQRALVDCLARVPSGLDATALRVLLGLSEADLQRLLLCEEIRNVVVLQRGPRGIDACLSHESLGDLYLGEKDPQTAVFHKRVAAHFLGLVHKDPHHVEALSAHSYHIRLSGDPTQFMQDFPRTLRLKQGLGLLHLLASEYRLLLMWSRTSDTPINRALCTANLARIYQQLGAHQEALRHHKEALDTYQKQRDRSGTAVQLGCIASALCDLGHHDEAIKSLQQAMAINEALGSKAALASDLTSLGTLQERLGRLHDALHSHQRALDLYRGLKDELDAATQLSRIAAIHRKLGNRREAVARFQEAWRLNSRNGAARAEIDDLCNLGFVFEELKETGKAVTCVQQAIELDHSLGDRHAEGSHLRILGSMHLEQHEPAEAVRCLEQAVTLARSFGDPGGEAAGLLALAKAQRAAGRPADARQALEQAAALAARLSDADTAEQVRTALGELGSASGEQVESQEKEESESGASKAAADAPAVEPPPEEVGIEEAHTPLAEEPELVPAAEAAEILGGEDVAALRAELAEARREIAELKAEVEQQKQIADALKEVMAKAMQDR